MTPKEKAEELYSKMYGETPVRVKIKEIEFDKQCAKQCTLIAVDEIINDNPNIYDSDRLNFKYWNKVKQEIEKL